MSLALTRRSAVVSTVLGHPGAQGAGSLAAAPLPAPAWVFRVLEALYTFVQIHKYRKPRAPQTRAEGTHLCPRGRPRPCHTQPEQGLRGQEHWGQLQLCSPCHALSGQWGGPLCKTVNSTRSSCYRQPPLGASGSGLEAGGELFITVAAVPTAILEGRKTRRERGRACTVSHHCHHWVALTGQVRSCPGPCSGEGTPHERPGHQCRGCQPQAEVRGTRGTPGCQGRAPSSRSPLGLVEAGHGETDAKQG